MAVNTSKRSHTLADKRKAMSLGKQSFLEMIENTLFNIAYTKLGLKPICRCSIEELQEELNKRLEK